MLSAIKRKTGVFYADKGFTLIEIVVAMSLLLIIVFAFTPLILGSFQQIIAAGEKSHALFGSQEDMEVMLAEEEVYRGMEVPIKIDEIGFERIVRGGLVEADEFNTLIPWLPTIKLEPDFLTEGYPDTDIRRIEVTGTDTNFDGSSNCVITNDTGYSFSPSLYVTDPENAHFFLPTGDNRLTNAGSKYRIIITTNTDTGQEIVRARMGISLPGFVSVGDGIIQVSINGTFWETSTVDDVDFNHVIWGDGMFVAVGEDGEIYTLEDKVDWTQRDSGTENDLNHVIWMGEEYIAVGNNGTIVTSPNGRTWDVVADEELPEGVEERNFYGIAHGYISENETSAELTVVAGDEGMILTKKNNGDWEEQVTPSNNSLNSVVYYEEEINDFRFTAVGDNGIVLTSADGIIWNDDHAPPQTNDNLNSVIYAGEDVFIAVGDSGTIIRGEIKPPDILIWNPRNSGTNRNLYDIEWGGMEDDLKYVAVGDRAIMTSSNGRNWSINSSAEYLKSIASRR